MFKDSYFRAPLTVLGIIVVLDFCQFVENSFALLNLKALFSHGSEHFFMWSLIIFECVCELPLCILSHFYCAVFHLFSITDKRFSCSVCIDLSYVRNACMHAKLLPSRPTLCNPMDCSLPGSFVHGISKVRILEWVGISSSGDLPNPAIKLESPAWQADSLLLNHLRSPCYRYFLSNFLPWFSFVT